MDPHCPAYGVHHGDPIFFSSTVNQVLSPPIGSRSASAAPLISMIVPSCHLFSCIGYEPHDHVGQWRCTSLVEIGEPAGQCLIQDGQARLAFLDQANAFNRYDFDRTNSDTYNIEVTGQQIPGYLCPSSPMRRQVPGPCDAGRAPGNYAVSIGTVKYDPYATYYGTPPSNLDGAIVYTDSANGKTSFRDFTDGTSTTLLVGETAYNMPDYTFSSGACSGEARYSFTYWSSPYPGSTASITSVDFNPHDIAGDGIYDTDWLYSFRSDHVGGVQFVFVDGSVHFVSENIDATLLNSLATRAGGEVVGEF